MATKRAFNPTDSPVVIDTDGHTLGGGEWADVDPNTDTVKQLVDKGLLLFPADFATSTPAPAPADAPSSTNPKE